MLWGGGSQARLVEGIIGDLGLGSVTLIFDPLAKESSFVGDHRFVQEIDFAAKISRHASDFVVCIGNYAGYARSVTSNALQESGLNPLSVVHDTAWLDPTVSNGNGLQIMARATIQKFVSIGDWTIINTGAVIDHECQIGAGVHIMGSAAIAGRVRIDDYATIGTNATVLPDVRIGSGAIIGAGAVVLSDVQPNQIVAGVPAKFIRYAHLENPAELVEKFISVLPVVQHQK